MGLHGACCTDIRNFILDTLSCNEMSPEEDLTTEARNSATPQGLAFFFFAACGGASTLHM